MNILHYQDITSEVFDEFIHFPVGTQIGDCLNPTIRMMKSVSSLTSKKVMVWAYTNKPEPIIEMYANDSRVDSIVLLLERGDEIRKMISHIKSISSIKFDSTIKPTDQLIRGLRQTWRADEKDLS